MNSGLERSIFIVENLTRRCVIAARIRSANDSAERRRGLLDASEMDADAGLWINPCEAVHTFGMHVPLDVLFLDANMRVRKIIARIRPNRVSFCLSAKSALEIRAGGAVASGTKCGDQLALRRCGDPAQASNVANPTAQTGDNR